MAPMPMRLLLELLNAKHSCSRYRLPRNSWRAISDEWMEAKAAIAQQHRGEQPPLLALMVFAATPSHSASREITAQESATAPQLLMTMILMTRNQAHEVEIRFLIEREGESHDRSKRSF